MNFPQKMYFPITIAEVLLLLVAGSVVGQSQQDRGCVVRSAADAGAPNLSPEVTCCLFALLFRH